MEVLCYLGFVLHWEFPTWNHEEKTERIPRLKFIFGFNFDPKSVGASHSHIAFILSKRVHVPINLFAPIAWRAKCGSVIEFHTCSPDDSISCSTCCHNSSWHYKCIRMTTKRVEFVDIKTMCCASAAHTNRMFVGRRATMTPTPPPFSSSLVHNKSPIRTIVHLHKHPYGSVASGIHCGRCMYFNNKWTNKFSTHKLPQRAENKHPRMRSTCSDRFSSCAMQTPRFIYSVCVLCAVYMYTHYIDPWWGHRYCHLPLTDGRYFVFNKFDSNISQRKRIRRRIKSQRN